MTYYDRFSIINESSINYTPSPERSINIVGPGRTNGRAPIRPAGAPGRLAPRSSSHVYMTDNINWGPDNWIVDRQTNTTEGDTSSIFPIRCGKRGGPRRSSRLLGRLQQDEATACFGLYAETPSRTTIISLRTPYGLKSGPVLVAVLSN